MDFNELQELIAKYNRGTATTDEQQVVEQWYDSLSADESSLNHNILTGVKSDIHARLDAFIAQDEKPIGIKTAKLNPFRHPQRWLSAAVVLLIFSISFYFYQHQRKPQPTAFKPTQLLKNDIAPGGNQAVLTLANGTQIVLNVRSKGKLAIQGNTQINKVNDHLIVYNTPEGNSATSTTTPEPIKYNTFSTPRGGKYDVILPDGTKVYLNAESSLRFPTYFSGNYRLVELTGEAYFEVTKNTIMPFKVISGGQTVQVLGTHFNINAYKNEPSIRTTLLEGSVQISKGAFVKKIVPGQQAIIKAGSDRIIIQNEVDLAEVMAWKNDLFYFNEADINTIARQVGRWYDVDVIFGSNLSVDRFTGKISRAENASQVLKILEISGVHFKIEGRKVIIR